MTSAKVNIEGSIIPFLATSIIPDENVAPIAIPRLATIIIVFIENALDPIDELRKLIASLLTPTIKSVTANANNATTKMM